MRLSTFSRQGTLLSQYQREHKHAHLELRIDRRHDMVTKRHLKIVISRLVPEWRWQESALLISFDLQKDLAPLLA